MKCYNSLFYIYFALAIIGKSVFTYEIDTYEFLMPNVWPNKVKFYFTLKCIR